MLLEQINRCPVRKTESEHLQQLLKQQYAERDKLNRATMDLYPDWKSGILTQEEYMRIKANLNEKLDAVNVTIKNLEKSSAQYAKGVDNENSFLSAFRKYGNITELTRPMLVELVKEIQVHDPDHIEIILNFQDEYEQLMYYLEMNQDIIQTA